MSVPCEPVGSLLLAESMEGEPGVGQKGFGASERRYWPHGRCWRKSEPKQASNAWGLAYESWEWDGADSDWAARMMRRYECRPSRVDVHFTYSVPPEVGAKDLWEACRRHFEAKRLTPGETGEGEVYTCYIGSRASARRIRIYRKDLRDPGFDLVCGPSLRVELTLREKRAHAWWNVWRESERRGIEAAAAHIFDMTGKHVLGEAYVDVPAVEIPPAVDVAQQVFTFLEQHGERVSTWEAAGVDLVELAKVWASRKRRGVSARVAAKRSRDRLAELERAGVDQVRRAVFAMMRRADSHACEGGATDD